MSFQFRGRRTDRQDPARRFDQCEERQRQRKEIEAVHQTAERSRDVGLVAETRGPPEAAPEQGLVGPERGRGRPRDS